jgi:DNA-binding protein YbaB
MENREFIKEKIEQSRAALDQKIIEFESENSKTKINIQFSQKINEIIFKGEKIDNELVTAINQAVSKAKVNFEKEMFQIVSTLGIKIS